MAWNGRHCDILIAIPNSGGEVYFEWAMEFAKVWLNAPPNTFQMTAPEPQIDTAREKLCEIALSMNAKYIFFLDSDVIPPRDVIKRLLRHNLPFVSGLYARRYHPTWNEMLIRGKDEKGNEGFVSVPEGNYERDELLYVDAVGFGCVLLKTDMLKDLEKPWFKWTEHSAIRGMSEDFYFCDRVRRAGYKVVVDTSVVCKHMGPVKILPGKGLMVEFKNIGQPVTDL